jgi:hypothetical protein
MYLIDVLVVNVAAGLSDYLAPWVIPLRKHFIIFKEGLVRDFEVPYVHPKVDGLRGILLADKFLEHLRGYGKLP